MQDVIIEVQIQIVVDARSNLSVSLDLLPLLAYIMVFHLHTGLAWPFSPFFLNFKDLYRLG